MKLLKWLFQCPLPFLLVIGWMGLSIYALSEQDLSNSLTGDLLNKPVFMALLGQDEDVSRVSDTSVAELKLETGQDDGFEKQELGEATQEEAGAASGSQAGEWEQSVSQDASQSSDGLMMDGQAIQPEETVGVTEYVEYEPKETDSQYYTDPGKYALTTTYPYETVDEEYFKDALFIGDSRTVGLQDYSGLDTATFFAKTGLNVYHLLSDPFLEDPKTGDPVDVTYMLKHYQYKKIYIMVGINELGTGNTQTFQNAYAQVLSKILKWQPDAVVYIQGIIKVSAKKNKEDPIINNTNINAKNVAISELADGKQIFYLDINPVLTDKKGNLRAKYTFDEVHMYAQYYGLWRDFLFEHAVVS